MISTVLPKSGRPKPHTEQAIMAEIRRMFELNRVVTHAQIKSEVLGKSKHPYKS